MAVNPVQVQKFLGGIDYPVSKSTLIETAQARGADENVMQTLQNLPYENFNSPNDISEAIGMME